MKRIVAVLCALCLFAPPVPAWNFTGHRVITFLAYSHLNSKARGRVDAILRAHPDYASILAKGAAQKPWDVARNAFVTASTWPDLLRNDPRFSDDGKLPPAPGFPTSHRHTDWHYINTPWPAEFAKQPVPPVNGLSQLPQLLDALKASGPVTPEMAYALPWLLHVVTDLHQPLHAVSRFEVRNGKADHDRGGNGCYVEPGRNLHSLWDGLLGRDDSETGVARLAASIADETPSPTKLKVKPADWIREAEVLAPTHVYTVTGCSDRERPVALPAGYVAKAESAARTRAALAAYRLAKMLNDKLGK